MHGVHCNGVCLACNVHDLAFFVIRNTLSSHKSFLFCLVSCYWSQEGEREGGKEGRKEGAGDRRRTKET